MRQLAKDALTESLQKACLRAAKEYEGLAAQLDAEQVDEDEETDQE